ncbi:MAG TPA: hypothetical protein VGL70_25080 [Candidatus Binatia bacterium]|jgi:hypothetical protein
MIPYQVYKLIHLVGVLMLFLSVGGLILDTIHGADRKHPWRKVLLVTHGVGIVLTLVAGFGMLARIGIYWSWPGWVAIKVGVWVIFAALPAIIVRNPSWTKTLWWTAVVLGGIAAYLAGYKPF